MTGHACPQCGAHYESSDDSCEGRFDTLIALDHSRQEPWGSRHGSAFAAFALQHPAGRSREALERCWTLLYRIWVAGDDPHAVAQALRQIQNGGLDHLTAPPFPEDASESRSFRVTIADLGKFERESYPRLLEAWCRATLEALGVPSVDA
jgi:uncharacterized protein DUF5946